MEAQQLEPYTEDYREEVIHKLSQPVTALQGSIEVALLLGQSADDQREALQIALQQANRLASILEDLRENQNRVH